MLVADRLLSTLCLTSTLLVACAAPYDSGALVEAPSEPFTFEELHGVRAEPVDVVAEEHLYAITPPGRPTRYVRTLVVAFGEEDRVADGRRNEFRLLVSRTSTAEPPDPIAAGTYDSDLWLEEETGEHDDSGEITVAARKVAGTITIVRRTESSVEGTFEVADADGEVALRGSFVAPICTTPEAR